MVADILVYRDKDHLSVPFVRARAGQVAAALDEQLAFADRG